MVFTDMKQWREIARDAGLLWLRVLMGAGLANHGFGKVFGDRMDSFAVAIGKLGFPMPYFFAWAAALSEFLGGILIVLGLGTRFAAFFVVITMSVAAFVRHLHDPFRVKELALVYGVMAVAVLLMGAGRYSLDHLICCRSNPDENRTVTTSNVTGESRG